MGCYRCANLDVKQKSPGKVDGNLYYCKKLKTYVNPSSFKCEKFVANDNRVENHEVYEQGKKYYNDKTPIALYLVLLVILIIVGLILGVFW